MSVSAIVTQKVEQPGGSLLKITFVQKDWNFSWFFFLSGVLPVSVIFTALLLKAYLRTQTKLLVQNSERDEFSNSCCSEHTQTIRTLPLWLRFLRNEKRVSCLNGEAKNLQHFLSESTFHPLSKAIGRNMWAKTLLTPSETAVHMCRNVVKSPVLKVGSFSQKTWAHTWYL